MKTWTVVDSDRQWQDIRADRLSVRTDGTHVLIGDETSSDSFVASFYHPISVTEKKDKTVKEVIEDHGFTARETTLTAEEAGKLRQLPGNKGQRVKVTMKDAVVPLVYEFGLTKVARAQGYGRGLDQGHHDAYMGNLPPCPECGKHQPRFIHEDKCSLGVRG